MLLKLLRSMSHFSEQLSDRDEDAERAAPRLSFADWIAMVGSAM